MTKSVQKAAVVTGGGSGIGKAIALLLARQGFAVAAAGRRREPLLRLCREIESGGGRALAIPADLADSGSPRLITEQTAKALGGIDVIVNCAAAIDHKPLEQATEELFDLHMAVNARAPFLLVREALPYLRRSADACVVNISSSSASLAIPGQSMYGCSKAALEYLTKSLAAELAPCVRVNCVAPGPIDTPIHLVWAGDDVAGAYERMCRELPLKRMGKAEEVASCVGWLVGESGRFVTGAVIPVDGGQVLPGALSNITL